MHQSDRHSRDLLVVHLGVEPGFEEVDRLFEARVPSGVAGLGAARGGSQQQGEEGGGAGPESGEALHS